MTNSGDFDPNPSIQAVPEVPWDPATAASTPAAVPPPHMPPPTPYEVPPGPVPDFSEGAVIDPGTERVQQPVNAALLSAPFAPGPFAAPAYGSPASSTAVLTSTETVTRRSTISHQEIIDLYATHHDSLVRFAALMAPEDGMAEDLVQEAFVRLYKSWKKIREPEKVPAYLRSTVANLARGRGRRLSTARRNQPAPALAAASAEEGALRTETQAEVVALLRTLPDRQRQCLVLRYYEGQTESQIATTLGISVGSVRTHTTRGMAALGTRLGAST